MNEKKGFKQELKDWWDDNKRAIKAGVVCGFIGIVYGLIKGFETNNDMWLRHGFTPAQADDEDDFVYDETTVDDPELLELIRLEEEMS